MNKIGFKNFRRFLNFEPIAYSDITFLVGRNNSGKSTLVKAVLLIDTYLKSNKVKKFSFGNNVLEDANIVTYDRARNHFAKENLIQFTHTIDDFLITIIISSEDQKTDADIHLFSIKDTKNQYEFVIEPQLQTVSFKRSEAKNDHFGNTLLNLTKEIEKLEAHLNSSNWKKSSKEFIITNDKLQALKSKRNIIAHNKNPEESDSDIVNEPEAEYGNISEYSISFYSLEAKTFTGLIDILFHSNKVVHDKEYKQIQEGNEESEDFYKYRAFHEERNKIRASFDKFEQIVERTSYYYIGANLTKQSALFAIRDKNNAIAQAIHDFEQLDIQKGQLAYLFILKWMKLFEVGDSFNNTI